MYKHRYQLSLSSRRIWIGQTGINCSAVWINITFRRTRPVEAIYFRASLPPLASLTDALRNDCSTFMEPFYELSISRCSDSMPLGVRHSYYVYFTHDITECSTVSDCFSNSIPFSCKVPSMHPDACFGGSQSSRSKNHFDKFIDIHP